MASVARTHSVVVGAVSKGGVGLSLPSSGRCSRPLEVPQWMFDAATCCRTQLVRAADRRRSDLRELIAAATVRDVAAESTVLQAEHHSPRAGGAHATQNSTAFERSAVAVPADSAAAVERTCRRQRASRTRATRATSAPARHARAARRRCAMSDKIQAQHLHARQCSTCGSRRRSRSRTTRRARSCSMRCRAGCAISASPTSRSSMRIWVDRRPARRRAAASSAWWPKSAWVASARSPRARYRALHATAASGSNSSRSAASSIRC